MSLPAQGTWDLHTQKKCHEKTTGGRLSIKYRWLFFFWGGGSFFFMVYENYSLFNLGRMSSSTNPLNHQGSLGFPHITSAWKTHHLRPEAPKKEQQASLSPENRPQKTPKRNFHLKTNRFEVWFSVRDVSFREKLTSSQIFAKKSTSSEAKRRDVVTLLRRVFFFFFRSFHGFPAKFWVFQLHQLFDSWVGPKWIIDYLSLVVFDPVGGVWKSHKTLSSLHIVSSVQNPETWHSSILGGKLESL